MASRRILLKCNLSPGDITMLTAAVRDLHLSSPDEFVVGVDTSAGALWENNPFVTPLSEFESGVETLDMHYPLIQESNRRPYHFIHGFAQYLESKLGIRIPITAFRGDIHLSSQEKSWMSQVAELGYEGPFWIIVAGGKFDFTAKWWNPASYQAVIDHFYGRIPFVQVGETGHWHSQLERVLDFRGRTDTRQFVRLMHHADGAVCPVTFAMHLAAAVEAKAGKPKSRACVVIAGGREPMQWEAYPHHQFLSTNGALRCCEEGGCWKSRCQPVGDGDSKDLDLCPHPIQVANNLNIPKCMDMIRPADVVRRIELYYEGGALDYTTAAQWTRFESAIENLKQTPGRRTAL